MLILKMQVSFTCEILLLHTGKLHSLNAIDIIFFIEIEVKQR